jgi:hypothetical protein
VGLVVTGISQNGNIKGLEDGLKAVGLPLDSIQLIGPDDSTQGAARGVIDPGYMTGGTGQGTGVPGITSGRGSGIGGYGTRYFRNETLVDRLGDLGIPDDEVDNYVEALQAGRSVVAYFAKPESVAQVTDIFRGSGLVKVKTF